MIRKRAWQVAQMHYFQNMELSFQELCSDGFLIFLQVVDRYDASKGSFSTFLGENLRGIVDLHYRENKDILHFDYDTDILIEQNASFFDAFQKTLELYDSADTELSTEAQEILNYIISNPNKRHTLNSTTNYFRSTFSWSVKQVEFAFTELQRWWRGYNSLA